jgi:4-carboxymuconolactone decarboxylase
MSNLPTPYREFTEQHQRVWEAYAQLGEAASEAGPLDLKTRELIKLGMSAAQRAETAVHSHTHRALEAGATPGEIEHAIVIGVTTRGLPARMSALTWARAAIAAHQR